MDNAKPSCKINKLFRISYKIVAEYGLQYFLSEKAAAVRIFNYICDKMQKQSDYDKTRNRNRKKYNSKKNRLLGQDCKGPALGMRLMGDIAPCPPPYPLPCRIDKDCKQICGRLRGREHFIRQRIRFHVQALSEPHPHF